MHRKDSQLSKGARTGKTNKQRAKNRPPEGMAFVWFTEEMLISEAWRALSGNARNIVTRLCVEHMTHAATENGNLICTHQDFQTYGIRKPSIAGAIREAEFFGFIKVTKGYAFKGHRAPSLYRLTWLPNKQGEYPSNEWKAIKAAHVKAFKTDRTATNRLKTARKKNHKSAMDSRFENTVIPFNSNKGIA